MVCSPSGKLLPTSAPRPTTFHGANHACGRIPADTHRSVGRTPALPCQCHLGSPLRILRRDSVVVHSVAELAWMVATRQRPAQLGQVFIRSYVQVGISRIHSGWTVPEHRRVGTGRPHSGGIPVSVRELRERVMDMDFLDTVVLSDSHSFRNLNGRSSLFPLPDSCQRHT